jgi:hypothetical protein
MINNQQDPFPVFSTYGWLPLLSPGREDKHVPIDHIYSGNMEPLYRFYLEMRHPIRRQQLSWGRDLEFDYDFSKGIPALLPHVDYKNFGAYHALCPNISLIARLYAASNGTLIAVDSRTGFSAIYSPTGDYESMVVESKVAERRDQIAPEYLYQWCVELPTNVALMVPHDTLWSYIKSAWT